MASNLTADEALAAAADDLEKMVDEREKLGIPESFVAAQQAIKQMRIDARWLRARAVALRS